MKYLNLGFESEGATFEIASLKKSAIQRNLTLPELVLELICEYNRNNQSEQKFVSQTELLGILEELGQPVSRVTLIKIRKGGKLQDDSGQWWNESPTGVIYDLAKVLNYFSKSNL